jgi:uncharacterized protein (DUF2132 family)
VAAEIKKPDSNLPEKNSEPPRIHPRDPLHGVTLETVVNTLVQKYGWLEMGRRIPINPTLKSSLTFLRKTPWARQKVELWYLSEL